MLTAVIVVFFVVVLPLIVGVIGHCQNDEHKEQDRQDAIKRFLGQ